MADAASQAAANPDRFVYHQLFTPTFHHDVYPTIDPKNPSLTQEGRIILITGASGPIASVSASPCYSKNDLSESRCDIHVGIGTRTILCSSRSKSYHH